MKTDFEDWFYPEANRLAQTVAKRNWTERPPILVEKCWEYQQSRIDILVQKNKYLLEMVKNMQELVTDD